MKFSISLATHPAEALIVFKKHNPLYTINITSLHSIY